ncbi:hypothetical protein DQ04_04771010 [Trypanosoma grayi]|uniref:hypothetical protein n=1 Tax=Trypanosoma grayi TaxID=71804 RepID=UPI0004F4A5E2|nr:hypothetical protein DQ04_04771010 [Trypanosoma grayi]KEG09718.1 hypothetical protein DQ04_04771010 [Trypanosoma grayi]
MNSVAKEIFKSTHDVSRASEASAKEECPVIRAGTPPQFASLHELFVLQSPQKNFSKLEDPPRTSGSTFQGISKGCLCYPSTVRYAGCRSGSLRGKTDCPNYVGTIGLGRKGVHNKILRLGGRERFRDLGGKCSSLYFKSTIDQKLCCSMRKNSV